MNVINAIKLLTVIGQVLALSPSIMSIDIIEHVCYMRTSRVAHHCFIFVYLNKEAFFKLHSWMPSIKITPFKIRSLTAVVTSASFN